MADHLVIRLGSDSADTVEWIKTDKTGARHGTPRRGTLSEAADDVGSLSVLALIPADDVLLTLADVPAKGARLLQALPFALEEQLADDIDTLHFAAGTRRSSGRTPVAVIRREQLQGYLAPFAEVGIDLEGVYTETQGLAKLPGTISVLIDGDLLLLNDGAETELALRQLSPGDALVAIGALDDGEEEDEERKPLPKHVLVYLDQITNERYANDWLALRNELDSLETKLLPDGALPRLAATVSTGKAVNLLQGEFAVKRSAGENWRPWRMAAMLAGVVVALSIIGKVTEYFSLQREQQRLAVELEEQWRRSLPWISPMPSNPQSRLNSELRRMGAAPGGASSAHLMTALTALSNALSGTSGVKIEAIGFRGGTTDVQLVVPNTQILERIQTTIQSGDQLEAAIQRADPDDDGGIKSRFQIKATQT
ncbi:MAG: type II secretion system protein GspL [Pseudomonadota bacterium]